MRTFSIEITTDNDRDFTIRVGARFQPTAMDKDRDRAYKALESKFALRDLEYYRGTSSLGEKFICDASNVFEEPRRALYTMTQILARACEKLFPYDREQYQEEVTRQPPRGCDTL